MEETIKLVGHLRQRQRLEKLWRLDKLPSALMFTGANGIGKSLVAKELFQSLESFFEDWFVEQNAPRLYLGGPPRIS